MRRLLRVLAAVLLVAGTLVGWGLYSGVLVPLRRQVDTLVDWRPMTTIEVVDRHGEPLDRFSVERRTWVELDELPEHVAQAFVVAEDRRFFWHPGVDPVGIARAARANWSAGTVVEGGSTLTQQLVKNVLVGDERSVERKLREALAALLLERRLSKPEILEQYINFVYLGSGNYGVEAAARDYYGVSASELDVGQAALIAGLVPAPSRYSPRTHPERALQRRNAVLHAMHEAEVLDAVQLQLWQAQPVSAPLALPRPGALGTAYRTVVRRQVRRQFADEAAYRSGLVVRTPYDPAVQALAHGAVVDALWAVVDRQAGVEGRPPREELERPWCDGSAVVLDNETGGVVALVGGYDVALEGFVRATQGLRQPGSAFKPIVYAAALQDGRTQLDRVDDVPLTIGRWSPHNYADTYRGRLTLRRALAVSSNVGAVRVARDVGVTRVSEVAHQLGIHTPLHEELPLALGASEVTVLDLAAAYATIARGGLRAEPVFFEPVFFEPDGTSVELQSVSAAPERVLEAGVAAELRDMLGEVVRAGTGRRARHELQERAGKTGTTTDYHDAWFVGFTPRHTIAVWIGTDDGSPLGEGETGSRAALPAWVAIADALTLPGVPERFDDEPEALWWPHGGTWVVIARGHAGRRLGVREAPDGPLPAF